MRDLRMYNGVRMALAICAVALAVPLASCSTTGGSASTPASASSTVATVDTTAEKSLIVAEEGYNTLAQAYVASLQAGTLPTSAKPQAKALLETSYGYLKKAEQAYAVGDSIATSNAIALLTSNSAALKALLGIS